MRYILHLKKKKRRHVHFIYYINNYIWFDQGGYISSIRRTVRMALVFLFLGMDRSWTDGRSGQKSWTWDRTNFFGSCKPYLFGIRPGCLQKYSNFLFCFSNIFLYIFIFKCTKIHRRRRAARRGDWSARGLSTRVAGVETGNAGMYRIIQSRLSALQKYFFLLKSNWSVCRFGLRECDGY